jgi:hypothetical protein
MVVTQCTHQRLPLQQHRPKRLLRRLLLLPPLHLLPSNCNRALVAKSRQNKWGQIN